MADFERTFAEARPKLLRFALELTRHRSEEAEDLVQQTAVRAFNSWQRVADLSTVQGWLFRILENLWRDELRNRSRRPVCVSESEVTDTRGLDALAYCDSVDLGDIHPDLLQAIEELHPVDRKVFWLAGVERESSFDVSAVVGLPDGTVRCRLHRIRQRLRSKLAHLN